MSARGGGGAVLATIDEEFLRDVGLGDLPTPHRAVMLAKLRAELELRIGVALSWGLEAAQLEEFEKLSNHDPAVVTAWLEEHDPHFVEDPLFQRLETRRGLTMTTGALLGEYCTLKWLSEVRPNYRETMAGILVALKAEVAEDAPALLAAFTAPEETASTR